MHCFASLCRFFLLTAEMEMSRFSLQFFLGGLCLRALEVGQDCEIP